MAEFLDRIKIVEEIIKLINDAKKEIVMVVPFIKISPTIWAELSKAEALNKEVLLIYREDSMRDAERMKLHSLSNLTIMNHPNVHAKCYLNEYSMVICSMNLYEHSEKNNREMGVLLKNAYPETTAYRDGLKEIRTIINASRLEKKSRHVQEKGFNFSIFDSRENWLRDYANRINKVFIHKRFEVSLEGHTPDITCFPYHENVSARLDYDTEGGEENPTMKIRRVAIGLHHPEETVMKIHDLFWKQFNQRNFEHFNIYWDYYLSFLTIYADRRKYPQWNQLDFDQSVSKFRQGLDLIIDYLKTIEKKVR